MGIFRTPALIMLVLGCAPKEVVRPPVPSMTQTRGGRIEPQAKALFGQAERAFNTKNYERALGYYQLVRQKYPLGQAALISSYRMGSIFYYRAEYEKAAGEFELFLSRYPDSDLAFDVTYNLAAALFQQGHHEKTYQILSRLQLQEIQTQGPRRAETVYELTSRTAALLGNYPAVVVAAALQMQLPLEERKRVELQILIESVLVKIEKQGELESLLGTVSEPVTRQKISERIQVLRRPEYTKQAEEAPRQDTPVVESTTGERRHVGVILPLSGRFASYGRKALDGILLASRLYDTTESSFQLFIEDSGSNPIVAAQAVDELVNEKNVMIIIGPLNRKESEAVASIASQLKVPNLSLTAKEGISEKSPYVFQNGITARIQMESLVTFCVREKQFSRFAVLTPDNEFGRDMAKEFLGAVEKAGALVVGFQMYPPEETDFRPYVQKIVALSDPHLHRKLEWAKLNQFIREEKARGIRDPKANLPPIVDFDALLIPDSPKVAHQILASLNYHYVDVEEITSLGTTEWNSADLLKQGGKLLEGALFPVGLRQAPVSKQQRFQRSFTDAYGTKPDLLSAQAFEAMELVGFALQNINSNDRGELLKQLLAMRDFESSLGTVTVDRTRIVHRKLPIVMLGRGGTFIEQ